MDCGHPLRRALPHRLGNPESRRTGVFTLLLVASLLLVAMPGALSSVLAPSSDARSP